MIVVDSSVLIAHFRDVPSEMVNTFRRLSGKDYLIVGDIVRLEILQGARDEHHAHQLTTVIDRFGRANMLDEFIATEAARHFRLLRAKAITLRKTVNLIIGTYCIVNDYELLHLDRDFEPMQRHLGLRIAKA